LPSWTFNHKSIQHILILIVSEIYVAVEVYTNSWAVHLSAGPEVASLIAEKQGFINLGKVFEDDDYYHFKHRAVAKRSFTRHWSRHIRLKKHPKVHWVQQQVLKRRNKRDAFVFPNDPLYSKQWYMNGETPYDLNVRSAWKKGYTGDGVVVTILDDGIEKNHPDLSANYDPKASYDINGEDPDPQPRYSFLNENRHGTRCAGEVAAVANNGICGAGIAYNAKIGGVRMLDGPITDIVEARSLSMNRWHIHIYSASWGPEDDGKTVDGPGNLANEAIYKGIVKGRSGLGSIFVWASGNGGLHKDNCNCDGYTTSIYTLSVGSTTEGGNVPWYSEACASTLTTTYSSGFINDRKIVTTDLRHQCTETHTGTSASAPLAAGIIALALEANPTLTWRDMQHVVLRASKPQHLKAEDWVVNGVGRKVSHHYGYGLLDAAALVDLAKKWVTVQPQRKCFIEIVTIPHSFSTRLEISKNVLACAGSSQYIHSLEHVQATVSLIYSRRGDLQISLTSPMGTTSTLVAVRPYDLSTQGYSNWSFMSTHFWDENPQGVWTLELENKGDYSNTGLLIYFELKLYGTNEDMMTRATETEVVSDCKKYNAEGACEECKSPYYAFGKLCITYCPPYHYKSTKTLNVRVSSSVKANTVKVCTACHSSCYSCNGNTANNCTACPPFATYDEILHSCSAPVFPRVLTRDITQDKFHHIVTVVGIILGAPFTIFCLLALVSW
uniref:Proprotein convertase subtilisin/kexin type 4 n=1 Tax=Latimeria chalumnae TaxID=7897 RepID=H3AF55_LATCH